VPNHHSFVLLAPEIKQLANLVDALQVPQAQRNHAQRQLAKVTAAANDWLRTIAKPCGLNEQKQCPGSHGVNWRGWAATLRPHKRGPSRLGCHNFSWLPWERPLGLSMLKVEFVIELSRFHCARTAATRANQLCNITWYS
jgi:hypothetical protein